VRSACASLSRSVAHRLLQHTYDARARRAYGSSSLARCGTARGRVASRCRVVRSPKQPAARHTVLRRGPTDAFVSETPADEPRELLSQRSPRVPRGPSKGLTEASSPPRFSSRAPELPAVRFEGAGGSLRYGNRPKTHFRRRPAKVGAFRRVEVLSTEPESEHAVKAHAPPWHSDRDLSHAAHSLA